MEETNKVCPACQEMRITGHGKQVVSLTEHWRNDDIASWETEDWHEKLGKWSWTCCGCGHAWTTQEGRDDS